MRRPLSFGLVFAFTTASLFGQKSEAEQRADIAFAKGLAEMGFVGLSEEVIRSVESAGLSGTLAEEVALLRCDTLYDAAKANASQREKLLKQAVDGYQAFLDKYKSFGNEDLLARAQTSAVEVDGAYARILSASLEDLAGEELTKRRDEARKFLEGAVGRVNDLIREQEELEKGEDYSETQRRRMFQLLLNGAELNLQLAGVQELPTTFGIAENMFIKLSDKAGEGTPWSLRAFIGIGDVYSARAAREEDFAAAKKLYEEAAGYYEFAVDFSMPKDLEAWKVASAEMDQNEKQSRFLFLQLGTPGLIKSWLSAGDTKSAVENALHFVNTWKREGLDLIQPQGYMALLDVAQALVDAGGFLGGNPASGDLKWYETQEEIAAAGLPKTRQRTTLDHALSLAQAVSTEKENKGTNLQIRAQRVIGTIIQRPGVKVDPSVLIDAAKGEFAASNWSAAIDGFKRTVSALALQDQATQQEKMPEVLWHIARSYQRMDRTLEAAAVYEYTLDAWRGDPVFDKNSAQGLYDCAQLLKKAVKGDATIDALAQRADDRMKEVGSDSGEIDFRDAEKLFAANDFERAKAKYATVSTGTVSYDKALVNVGLCDFKLGRYADAIKVFENYLTKYLKSAESATTDARRIGKRKEATATARFYWGLSEFELAGSGSGSWQKVVDVLGTFQDEFPEQNQLAPAAMYRVLIAYGRLNQQAKVKSLLGLMLTSFPDSKWTGLGATESYKMLKAQFDAEKDPAKQATIEREMAENLQVLNRTSSKPAFPNMRQESRHWMNLAEWATAEEVLQRIVKQFSADPKLAEDMTKRVLPDLGEALLRQKKVVDAMTVLDPLVKDEKNKASKSTAFDYVQAVGGWLEVQGTKVLENAGGATKKEDFEGAIKPLIQLVEGTEKWTTEWYGYKAQQIYFVLRWSALDGKQMDTARELMNYMTTQIGGAAQFKADGMPEDTRAKFLWLASKVK
ncbi:MAG: hypothetical protein HUU28_07630 [Planctomycetaceae bacterium]|nr:hypothetical protein [Planctomycetaceae bacterium]